MLFGSKLGLQTDTDLALKNAKGFVHNLAALNLKAQIRNVQKEHAVILGFFFKTNMRHDARNSCVTVCVA